jgi:hypothetical protein
MRNRYAISSRRWAHDLGAQWMRLGVVEGNTRAERFWERCAFVEMRRRDGVEMGTRTHTIRVMAKPLDGGTPREYWRWSSAKGRRHRHETN